MKSFFYTFSLLCSCQLAIAQSSGIDMVHLKLNQNIEQMEEIRTFYKQVLRVKLVSPEGAVKRDYLQFDNGQRLNLIYVSKDKVPGTKAFLNGVWIRLETADFRAIQENVMASGVHIVKEIPGRELYFQAPGGQVWRLVKKE